MTDVPVVVTEEAAAHVAGLGMQHELEQMLDWVRQRWTPLEGIRVTLEHSMYTNKLPPRVFIRAFQGRAPENAPLDLPLMDWFRWASETFPLKVCTIFIVNAYYVPFSESAWAHE
jgi:hypothetical protein